MTAISVIPAAGGEAIQLGPVQMRILEDGRTTGHRLGVGEITIAAHAEGPPQHRHARHDEGFMSCQAPPGSPWRTKPTTRQPGPSS